MLKMKISNTNSERLNILKCALKKADKLTFSELEFSNSLYVKIRAFLPIFEKLLIKQSSLSNIIDTNNKAVDIAFDEAKMYITHFIIVLNLAIQRNKYSMNIRKYYGFKIAENTVPEINTKEDLIKIGKQIIEGEHKRTGMGGMPVLNPTISMVEIYYNKFLEISETKTQLHDSYIKCNEKVRFLQSKADILIKALFEQILNKNRSLSKSQKIEKLSEYGLKNIENTEIESVKTLVKLSA